MLDDAKRLKIANFVMENITVEDSLNTHKFRDRSEMIAHLEKEKKRFSDTAYKMSEITEYIGIDTEDLATYHIEAIDRVIKKIEEGEFDSLLTHI